ncbi:hypothetical protein GOP47_0013283 [Adiantum capillus-veneris]|uniref:SET domain-containing protein n=1 Tax=Adiantum capillus-veneris TaxID=13818 RepID=A0A9D4ZEE1_ADICA|nr:hypothetical protein GOP47_0013283 [Adiantum capillus-veneris]
MDMASYTSGSLHAARPVVCSSSASKSKSADANKLAVDWGCDAYTPKGSKFFQEWLTSQRLPPQKLTLQPVESGGRGLVAKTNIRRGEKLLYVPFSLVITCNSEWTCSQSRLCLSAEDVPDWPFLATYLISEASKGKDSPWHPYFSALPRKPESILLWSETEVRNYLFASSIINQALERIAEVENTFASLDSSIYKKHPDLFPSQFFNAQSFKWAFGILFSRLVRLQSLNEQVALVPWADMVNHSSQVKACLDYEAASKTIILTTDKAYQPSEQVFISYGDKSKGEILLSYGFVSANADGMDSLDISLSLSRDDEMFAAKQAALEEHGLSSTCKYPITIGGIPSQLFAFSYLIACPSSLESRFSQMAAAAASKGVTRLDGFRPFTFDVPLDVDIQAYETILKTVEASLGKISRFLGENEKMNDAGMQKGNDGKLASLGLSGKLKMAYTLCVSEQRILQRAQYILRSKLRELRARKASSGEAGSGFLYGLGKLFK